MIKSVKLFLILAILINTNETLAQIAKSAIIVAQGLNNLFLIVKTL
jgi:hypothetical protein